MLKITIPTQELYDEKTNEFFTIEGRTLSLEHSLVSLSKWEAKWHKPFITGKNKTREETVDYIRCMTITQNVDPRIYEYMSNSVIKEVCDYIDDPMTATVINERRKPSARREAMTSEVIYYWMVALGIPFECQKWHLNRLMTLIRVCNIKQDADNNKMSKNDILKQNAALNAARRAKYKSKG